jgi:hypothetical protein
VIIEEKYCSGPVQKLLHRNLAEYWSSVYSSTPKSYVHPKTQTVEYAFRYVQSESLMDDDTGGTHPNVRRLGSEPWHLLGAEKWAEAIELVTSPDFIFAMTKDASLLDDLVDFCGDAIMALQSENDDENSSSTAVQEDSLKEATVSLVSALSKLREFHSFVLSNLSAIAQGPLKFISVAANMPKGSNIASETRLWAERNKKVIWADWVNRPKLENAPLPILTIRDSTKLHPFFFTYREMIKIPSSGREYLVAAGLREDLSRVVSVWELKTGERVTKIELERDGEFGYQLPLVGRVTQDGSRLVLASMEVLVFDMTEVAGEFHLTLRHRATEDYETQKSGKRFSRVLWTKNNEYLACVLNEEMEREVVCVQLRNSETLEVVATHKFAKTMLVLPSTKSHFVFADEDTNTEVWAIDVNAWAMKVASGIYMSGPDDIDAPLKLICTSPHEIYPLNVTSFAFHDNHIFKMLLPTSNNTVLNLLTFEHFTGTHSMVPIDVGVDVSKLDSATLSPDGNLIALAQCDKTEIKILHTNSFQTSSFSQNPSAKLYKSVFGVTYDENQNDMWDLQYVGFPQFSKDSKMILSDGENFSHQLWNITEGKIDSAPEYWPPQNGYTLQKFVKPLKVSKSDNDSGVKSISLHGYILNEGWSNLVVLDALGQEKRRINMLEYNTPQLKAHNLVTSIATHPSRPLALVTTSSSALHILDFGEDLNIPPYKRHFMTLGQSTLDLVSCVTFISEDIPESAAMNTSSKAIHHPHRVVFTTGHVDGTVVVWSYGWGTVSLLAKIKVESMNRIEELVISHDGERILVIPTRSAGCCVWNWRRRQPTMRQEELGMLTPPTSPKPSDGAHTGINTEIPELPKSKTEVSVPDLTAYRIPYQSHIIPVPTLNSCAAFNPANSKIVAIGGHQSLEVVEVSEITGEIWSCKLYTKNMSPVAVGWSVGGEYLIGLFEDRIVRVYRRYSSDEGEEIDKAEEKAGPGYHYGFEFVYTFPSLSPIVCGDILSLVPNTTAPLTKSVDGEERSKALGANGNTTGRHFVTFRDEAMHITILELCGNWEGNEVFKLKEKDLEDEMKKHGTWGRMKGFGTFGTWETDGNGSELDYEEDEIVDEDEDNVEEDGEGGEDGDNGTEGGDDGEELINGVGEEDEELMNSSGDFEDDAGNEEKPDLDVVSHNEDNSSNPGEISEANSDGGHIIDENDGDEEIECSDDEEEGEEDAEINPFKPSWKSKPIEAWSQFCNTYEDDLAICAAPTHLYAHKFKAAEFTKENENDGKTEEEIDAEHATKEEYDDEPMHVYLYPGVYRLWGQVNCKALKNPEDLKWNLEGNNVFKCVSGSDKGEDQDGSSGWDGFIGFERTLNLKDVLEKLLEEGKFKKSENVEKDENNDDEEGEDEEEPILFDLGRVVNYTRFFTFKLLECPNWLGPVFKVGSKIQCIFAVQVIINRFSVYLSTALCRRPGIVSRIMKSPKGVKNKVPENVTSSFKNGAAKKRRIFCSYIIPLI